MKEQTSQPENVKCRVKQFDASCQGVVCVSKVTPKTTCCLQSLLLKYFRLLWKLFRLLSFLKGLSLFLNIQDLQLNNKKKMCYFQDQPSSKGAKENNELISFLQSFNSVSLLRLSYQARQRESEDGDRHIDAWKTKSRNHKGNVEPS